jgi:cation diffusion facilitator CzcD-associated flavoprotein CzcO
LGRVGDGFGWPSILRRIVFNSLCSRNPDWASFYGSGDEIEAFYQRLAKEYGVYQQTKFKHQIEGAVWDDEAALWRITVRNLETGESFVDSAEVFINCGGVLKCVGNRAHAAYIQRFDSDTLTFFGSNWDWPSIEGLDKFRGTLVHTANWDDGLNLKAKRVGVIGSGASAIQVVPAIQPSEFCEAQDLLQYASDWSGAFY